MTREEAIEQIKAWDFLDNNEKEVLETLIPELQNNKDEMIRKEIIDFLWKEKIFLQEIHLSVENNPKYRFCYGCYCLA